jgi:inositol oxygenase
MNVNCLQKYYIIRFYSLYAYHKHNEYKHLTNKEDENMFSYLKLFNSYDLYTKFENKN